MKKMLGVLFVAVTAFMLQAELIVYPDYPEKIDRDYAYDVSVTQGKETKKLVVWNHTEKSILNHRTRGGDVNRRFAEFAFSGEGVRVDIRVHQDIRSYAVFPSRLGLKSKFENGVISVWLDRPVYFGIRLNDYDKTILSVFADEPEDPKLVPQPGDKGVLYVSKWTDADSEDGCLVVDKDIKQVYIAPGAVLNARLVVKGDNILVNGRGMLLDPLSNIFRFDQLKAVKRGFMRIGGKNVTVRDIKLIDARTFNFISWTHNCKMFNVKAMSAMMCTDGFTIGGRDFFADNAWLYVGDNALVISGVNGCTLRNIGIGTSCAAIFPQGSNKIPAYLENIDIFRADDGIINNWHNGLVRKVKWHEMNQKKADKSQTGYEVMERPHQTIALDFKNLTAIDCFLNAHFFSGRNMGTLPKTLNFDNVSMIEPAGVSNYRAVGKRTGTAIRVRNSKDYLFTNNYIMNITNFWVGGKKIMDAVPLIDKHDLTNITVKCFSTDEKTPGVPLKPCRYEVSYQEPLKIYIGDSLQEPAERPCMEKGEVYLPVSLLRKAGIDLPTGKRRYAKLSDFNKIRKAVYNRELGEIRIECPVSGENLVKEVSSIKSVWQRVPSWLVKMDAMGIEDGERVYRLTQVEKGAGMQAVITDEVLRYGEGTYRLKFEAKLEGLEAVPFRAVMMSNDWRFERDFQIKGGEWAPYECEFDVKFKPGTDLAAILLSVREPTDRISFRKLSLVKVK